MSSNYFGKIFRFTTWGESHGKAIGCVIDGCPSMIDLCESDIQVFLNQRRPGQSKFTTQRNEDDRVEILSGVFEGKTTGTPISLIIYNNDQKSHDYGDIATKFRPGHADYAYHQKYSIRDYRGGGRSSARETAMRVAAGAVAKKFVERIIPELKVVSFLDQIGTIKSNYENFDESYINQNPFFSFDSKVVPLWEETLINTRANGSSLGGVVGSVVSGIPSGLGEPIYYKLDAILANAMMSINAVKGVEIGAGLNSSSLTGDQNADEMWYDEYKNLHFSSNNNGGITGGISTGQQITLRTFVKPTSSILIPKKTVDINKNNTTIITKGRHDPCVAIRAVPVCSAMIYCVLADMIMLSGKYRF
jgi:chorismate synthase